MADNLDRTYDGTVPVKAHEKAETGRRQKVVIVGRDGLPVKTIEGSADGYAALLVLDQESRRAMEDLTVALNELRDAILNQSSGSTGA